MHAVLIKRGGEDRCWRDSAVWRQGREWRVTAADWAMALPASHQLVRGKEGDSPFYRLQRDCGFVSYLILDFYPPNCETVDVCYFQLQWMALCYGSPQKLIHSQAATTKWLQPKRNIQMANKWKDDETH